MIRRNKTYNRYNTSYCTFNNSEADLDTSATPRESDENLIVCITFFDESQVLFVKVEISKKAQKSIPCKLHKIAI